MTKRRVSRYLVILEHRTMGLMAQDTGEMGVVLKKGVLRNLGFFLEYVLLLAQFYSSIIKFHKINFPLLSFAIGYYTSALLCHRMHNATARALGVHQSELLVTHLCQAREKRYIEILHR